MDIERPASDPLTPVKAELDKLRTELAAVVARIAVLNNKTDKPATPEELRERLQRERAERTDAVALERFAQSSRRGEGGDRPPSKHRREDLGARRSASLTGAALPQPGGKSRDAPPTEAIDFYCLYKGRASRISLLATGLPTHLTE